MKIKYKIFKLNLIEEILKLMKIVLNLLIFKKVGYHIKKH